MAMPQRDDLIDPPSLKLRRAGEMKRTDLLLERTVVHGEEAEAEQF